MYSIFLQREKRMDVCSSQEVRLLKMSVGSKPYCADIFVHTLLAATKWLRHLVGEADNYTISDVDDIPFNEFDYIHSSE